MGLARPIVVAQTSKSAVSQPLSRSVNGKSMASFFPNGGAITRPERPPHDRPGRCPGFAAIVAIKRCKRATILLLTQRHSNVVAQASKPACHGLPKTDPNVYAPTPATGILLFSDNIPLNTARNHCFLMQAPFPAAAWLRCPSKTAKPLCFSLKLRFFRGWRKRNSLPVGMLREILTSSF